MKTLRLDNLPEFYRSILEYWQYYKPLSTDETDIKDEVIWNNCNILIDKKPVFFRKLVFQRHYSLTPFTKQSRKILSL